MNEAPQPIIEVRRLRRRFRRTVALDGVSLSVPEGCVYGLVGENGAGKTTLIKHLLGLLRAEEGSVRVFGCDPVADSAAVLSQCGYLSEDRDLPGWMNVRELLHFASFFYPGWDRAYAEDLRDTFGLDPNAKLKGLSRGQLAKAGLLVALAHRPRLLVLDEPSSGLDPLVRRDILAVIIRNVAEEGRTVLFSSHLLEEVERVSDHVAILHRGRVPLHGSLDDLKESHCRIRLRGSHDMRPEWAGILAAEGKGTWAVTAKGSPELHRAAAEAAGFEVLEAVNANLEDIFMACAQTGNEAHR